MAQGKGSKDRYTILGIMTIIFFSVAETSKTIKSQAEFWVLFLLPVVTGIVNGSALSAIF